MSPLHFIDQQHVHYAVQQLCRVPFRTCAPSTWWAGRCGADMPLALVTSALQRALLAQRPAPGLIVHSDRGRTR